MRIIHTTLRYPPAAGGAESYAEGLVEHTRDTSADRDVRVLTSRLRTHGPISELSPERLLDDPPYVQRLHHAATPLISYPRLQALTYYIGHHRPDVLHSYGFWYQPADVTARYAKRHNIPFIFHPIYYENDTRRKPQWQLYKKTIGRHTFAAADVVAVISPFEQQLIESANFPVKRFELIPPGIDTDELSRPAPDPFSFRQPTTRILLSVSRLAASKGINEAITALVEVRKQFADTHLVIIGDDFGAEKKLKQQSTDVGLAQHVHFWGHVNRKRLIAAYQHADLLVFPSRYEAFGIAAAESLAAGTPVIGRNATAIPYVVPHERAGLLFTTPDELTRHILTLLTNDSQREQFAAAGQKHIQANFAWPRITKKLAELYESGHDAVKTYREVSK